MKLHLVIAVGFSTMLGLVGGCTPVNRVVLVRHAEKAAGGQDPDLTEAGRLRAETLAEVAVRERIEAIYVTPYKRTQQTAAPSAERLGLTPIVVPITTTAEVHAAAIAGAIRDSGKRRVLVVGHSNTVPLVMKQLGVAAAPTMNEADFGRMFIVEWKDGGPVEMREERYGG